MGIFFYLVVDSMSFNDDDDSFRNVFIVFINIYILIIFYGFKELK